VLIEGSQAYKETEEYRSCLTRSGCYKIKFVTRPKNYNQDTTANFKTSHCCQDAEVIGIRTTVNATSNKTLLSTLEPIGLSLGAHFGSSSHGLLAVASPMILRLRSSTDLVLTLVRWLLLGCCRSVR